MRVAAPKDMESSSSLSTLASEVLPPRPTTHKPNPRKARRHRPKRLPLGRRKGTGTVVQVSSWKTETPPSSLPLPIPRVNVQLPMPETSQTPTTPPKHPQIYILPSTPEARQSPPLRGEAPTVNVLPFKQLPRPPKGQYLEAAPPGPSQKKLGKQPAVEEPPQLLKISSSLVFQPAPKKFLGTYDGPPYLPFAGPSHEAGRKPRLQRHAPFVNLRDCWRTPETELTERLLGESGAGEQSASHPGKKRSVLARRAEEAVGAEADEETPLLAVRLASETETETETEPPSRLQTFGSAVFFPLIFLYTYFASAIATYFRDRDALSGPLGSHDTETARWLRHVDEEGMLFQRSYGSYGSYGSFASLAGSPVGHLRPGSMMGVPTVSQSRKGSRGSTSREEVRGAFGEVRWGNGIGEEYDPC
ncbi:hypothetical protein P171DRAFT_482217 [Karstenula rhodostoma CBS 690.94]|uniref:Uncharacterized protein n=1 Tax=Karstenula rhodostoma CBS 690.94 TaxID=1392251 RepID=A0A9P4PNT1_9PLEO|nr:hypothetical protein P171DRAFT_482217 [Karstenula rhodostoma CBS 690.94]